MLKAYVYTHMANIELAVYVEAAEEVEILSVWELHARKDKGVQELDIDGIKVFDGTDYTDLTTHICDEIIAGNLEEI